MLKLVLGSTQPLPHAISPGFGHTQLPDTQVVAAGHWWPQPPQLASSLLRSTHVPLHSTLLAEQTHSPPAQTWPAMAQLVSVRHCTHLLLAVSQYGVLPLQWASLVHAAQVCVVVLQ